MSGRVYAQAADARVEHLRLQGGRQEVDSIVGRPDLRVLGIEVKLGRSPTICWMRSSFTQAPKPTVCQMALQSCQQRPLGRELERRRAGSNS
ncbi:hypothetical protein JXA88_17140 [Candidatus Fermentibacteria bacterium]|nr:hypothetical protein [Candidatus Fermentibacteria bacterium]